MWNQPRTPKPKANDVPPYEEWHRAWHAAGYTPGIGYGCQGTGAYYHCTQPRSGDNHDGHPDAKCGYWGRGPLQGTPCPEVYRMVVNGELETA